MFGLLLVMKPWRLAACAFRDCRRLPPVADSFTDRSQRDPEMAWSGEGPLRQLSTMIAVCGGRGPDSGPGVPQTAIMKRRRGQRSWNGTAGVQPHDREHVRCGATEASVGASPPTADTRGGLSKSAITRKAKAGTWETGPPRVFMASHCEPRVPRGSDHAEIQRNFTYAGQRERQPARITDRISSRAVGKSRRIRASCGSS